MENENLETLPLELQIKIIKFLDFNDLSSIKNTSKHFHQLIEKNKDILPRRQLNSLTIIDDTYIMKPKLEVFDISINNQLLDKWQTAIDKQIPLYLKSNGEMVSTDSKLIMLLKNTGWIKHYADLILSFPSYPKSIDDFKIIYYWFKRIFCCFIFEINFKNYLINPKFIELIFDEEELKKFKLYGRYVHLLYSNTNLFKYYFDHLDITRCFYLRFGESNTNEYDILLNILLYEGNKIPEIWICRPNKNFAKFCNIILNQIEISEDCSKISPKIKFFSAEWSKLNIKGIEKNINKNEIKQYEITNIYNLKYKFYLKIYFRNEIIRGVKIERNI